MLKFNVGDQVRFTDRVPLWIRELYPNRTRIVSFRFYDDEKQSSRYYLGQLDYSFRSYMLREVSQVEAHTIGRPRTKRAYKSYKGKMTNRTTPASRLYIL